jgi:hypothetical protein
LGLILGILEIFEFRGFGIFCEEDDDVSVIMSEIDEILNQ